MVMMLVRLAVHLVSAISNASLAIGRYDLSLFDNPGVVGVNLFAAVGVGDGHA
jgi:hypothetical protein